MVLVDKRGTEIFDKKKIRYAQSKFSLTQAVSGYTYWTSNQIQARAKKLSWAALEVWTLPEEFNATLPNIGDTITLDDDFAALKGTKPASVFIFDTEIKIGAWNPLLREVVHRLYAHNADTFRRATQLENVRRSIFTTEPTDFKIDENFYMRGGFDTEFCLKTIKALVENFDSLGGTTLKDEIYFTIKH